MKWRLSISRLTTRFPNIDASNNYFRYSPDGGTTWVDIFIPEGSYDIVDINDTIQQKMRQNGHYDSVNEDYYITISARQKGGDLTQSYDKSPYTNRNVKGTK